MLKNLLTFSIIISICSCSKDGITQAFKNPHNGYEVMHYRKGRFINTNSDDYVVFYRNTNAYKKGLKSNFKAISKGNTEIKISIEKTIDKVVVFNLKNNKVEKKIELKNNGYNIFTTGYIEKDIEAIKKGKPEFGSWDGYCYLSDFNNNGLDEILFFQGSGMGFVPFIFEYKNDRMQAILKPDPSMYIMSEIRTINQNGKKIIMVFCYNQKPKRRWYKYAWDSSRKIYALIERGIEK